MKRSLYRCPNCTENIGGQQNYVRHLLEEARAAGRPGVTTNEFLRWGAGSRFGARIHELRHDWDLEITEDNELYTLVGVAASPAASRPAADPAPRGGGLRAAAGAGRETDDPWQRVWMCPRCIYTTCPGPVCSCGRRAERGWSLDIRSPAVDIDLPMAA